MTNSETWCLDEHDPWTCVNTNLWIDIDCVKKAELWQIQYLLIYKHYVTTSQQHKQEAETCHAHRGHIQCVSSSRVYKLCVLKK